jgi:CRISPR/Cas system-associated protein Csm6
MALSCDGRYIDKVAKKIFVNKMEKKVIIFLPTAGGYNLLKLFPTILLKLGGFKFVFCFLQKITDVTNMPPVILAPH